MMMAAPSWEALHGAGLTATQAAQARGASRSAAWDWAWKNGVTWADVHEARRRAAEVERGGPYAEPHVEACRALWVAVLCENWLAALGLSTNFGGTDAKRAAQVAQREARDWLGSPDFDLVCMFVGVDPDAVLEAYEAGIVPDTGDVRRVERRGAPSFRGGVAA